MSDNKPWSVLILSRHVPQAASSRLRTHQYIPNLQAAGAQVSTRSFFDENYLRHLYEHNGRQGFNVAQAYLRRVRDLLAARNFSVVWVEKELLPYLPGGFERWLHYMGIPYVVDYDDASFHTYDQHRRWIVRHLLGKKLSPLIRHANVVTVGNAYLENYAQLQGARKTVRIPTVVDLSRYPVHQISLLAPLRVGWIGTPATTKYLRLIQEPLRQLNHVNPLTFVTVGASPLHDFGVPLEQHPWSEKTEADILSTLDIGVMPLPDEPWERGKCGYKLIQYMACGRPVVASPVGVNRDIVLPSVGHLASTSSEWMRALSELASDRQRLGEMGARGRLLIERCFSVQSMAPVVVDTLQSVITR